MKNLSILPIIFMVTFLSCQVNGQNVKVIDPNEFEKTINESSSPQIIDVRTPDEYNIGHISGAENINFQDSDFKTQLLKLDKTRPVLVYCAVGGRSGKASKMMNELGFTKIYDLDGGANAWSASGKELVRD